MNDFLTGIEGITAFDIFLSAGPIIKLVFIYLALILIASSIIAIQRQVSKSPTSEALQLIGLCSLVVSLIGALYSGFLLYLGSQAAQTTSLLVLAPSIFEIALILGCGILVFIVCTIGNAGARAKVKT